MIYNYACWSCYGRQETYHLILFYIFGGGLNHYPCVNNSKSLFPSLIFPPDIWVYTSKCQLDSYLDIQQTLVKNRHTTPLPHFKAASPIALLILLSCLYK